MTTMEALHLHRKKDVLLQLPSARKTLLAYCKTMGKSTRSTNRQSLKLTFHRLITCGMTVDEAAFLFYDLDQACHSQLLVEAAAANGIPKKIIPDHVAQYSADGMQSAVSLQLFSCGPRKWGTKCSFGVFPRSTTSTMNFSLNSV